MNIFTPPRVAATPPEEAFHLPIPGLFADFDADSGGLGMTNEFLQAGPLTRIRIVQQWMRGFRELKDAAVVDLFRTWSADNIESNIVAQVDAFREHCEDNGITCPAELPVLLQRF